MGFIVLAIGITGTSIAISLYTISLQLRGIATAIREAGRR